MPLGPEWLRERRFWRTSLDRDVDDELAFHLAMRAELLEDAGMDRQTARDLANERFGDVADVREECLTITHDRERRMRRLEMWSAIGQHARYAMRRLRMAPGFSIATLLMLALGIGATTAVFSVVDGTLLRPLPFEQSERLVSLSHTMAVSGLSKVEQSDASFLLYQRHATTTLENIAAYRTRDVNLGALGNATAEAERVSAATVSASFFPTLRVVPLRGRVLRPDDDRVGALPVVVLSASLWHRKFGGDPTIVGRHLIVDGTEHEVIGIMPTTFRYPATGTALWLPLRLDPAHANPGSFNYFVVARLRAGMTLAATAAELAHYLPLLLDEFPSEVPREMWAQAHVTPVVTSLRDTVVGDAGRLLWILLGAVGLLLVIACANVASLFMVRAEGAQRELAIRMALGAGSRAVVAQYLAEALLLATSGGTLGVGLAYLSVAALRTSSHGTDVARLSEVVVDARVLVVALALTTLSALVISLIPILRAHRVAPGLVLKESSRSATVGRERQRARSTLVIAQVALALILLAGSSLMARSFARLRAVQPGFDARGVLTLRVALPRATYGEAAARLRFFDQLLAAVQSLPGVRAAALGDWVPLTNDHDDTMVQIEDHPLPAGAVPTDHLMTSVSPGHFATLGIPVLTGRTFARPEIEKPSTDVLVSRAFADRYWHGGSALGKRLRPGLSGPWYTIVGVVGDVQMQSLDRAVEPLLYFPLVTSDEHGPSVPRAVALALRTSGDPTALAPRLREIFQTLDPALPTYDELPMTTRLAASSARTRFVMLMLGTASVIALAMGMVGLYGVLAYSVSLRRREIGVRMALGASAQEVSRMIARRGIVLAAVGVGVGLLGAVGATRVLGGLLYGVSPTDPVALVGTCALLLAVASIASWLPARRAADVTPMEALRRD